MPVTPMKTSLNEMRERVKIAAADLFAGRWPRGGRSVVAGRYAISAAAVKQLRLVQSARPKLLHAIADGTLTLYAAAVQARAIIAALPPRDGAAEAAELIRTVRQLGPYRGCGPRGERLSGAEYAAARIVRDHPAIAARVLAGEFPSITAAAFAAGIRKKETRNGIR